MNDDSKSAGEAKELTPEARAIISRARRSFLFSIGLLIVGFIAIAGALVYRSSQSGPAAPTGADYVIAALKVPQGAEIVSAVAAEGKVTLTYRVGAMTSVRIYDGRSGAMIREIPILSD